MSELLTIDPELEVLLRELAADPDSSLLRVPRPKQVRSLFDNAPPVRSNESGLSHLERHLLELYGNELAWLLRQVALKRILEGPRSRFYVSRFVSAQHAFEVLSSTDIRSRLSNLRQSVALEHESLLRLVELCVADPFGSDTSPGALATASFRLQRSDQARIISAIELAHGSAPRTAIALLFDVLAHRPTLLHAASAWTYVGMAFSRLHEFQRAQDAYSEVCRLDRNIIFGWMGLLAMSIQIGDEGTSMRSSNELDSVVPPDCPAVKEWAHALISRRAIGDWEPTTAARRCLPRLRFTLGPNGQNLADAFA